MTVTAATLIINIHPHKVPGKFRHILNIDEHYFIFLREGFVTNSLLREHLLLTVVLVLEA